MIVEKRRVDGFTVLSVEGVIKLGESARFFADTLKRVLAEDGGHVLIDLARINYIDSTGIGELVGFLGRFQEVKRKLILVEPSDPIKKLLNIELDVRIIIASNEKLWDSARKGKFREDLYHRFNEFSIEVPPLRERRGDMMIFANHFLSLTNDELGKNVKGFSKEVETIFQNYIWYGNLRELKNVIKRATLLTDGEYIEAKSLPFEITNFHRLQFDGPAMSPLAQSPVPLQAIPVAEPVVNGQGSSTVESINPSYENKLKSANIDAEYEVILEALQKSNFNKSKAAKLLNIDRKTLYNKMKQYKQFKIED